jgi:hypothetical protein
MSAGIEVHLPSGAMVRRVPKKRRKMMLVDPIYLGGKTTYLDLALVTIDGAKVWVASVTGYDEFKPADRETLENMRYAYGEDDA